MIDPDILADIYEAGAMPERWPAVLGRIARSMGAIGGNLIRASDAGIIIRSSEESAEAAADFVRLGWNEHNSRVGRLIERQPYPGFLTDSDLHSEEELATLPMYAEFLNPRGFGAGAGTMVQGSKDDSLILAIEAFPDHAASRAAVPRLDALRPHLARAAALSARIEGEQRRAAVHVLEAMGVPAAMLDQGGRVREANAGFARALGSLVLDRTRRMQLTDALADQALLAAFERLRHRGVGSSVPLRDEHGLGRAALHLVPLAGEARDLFTGIAAIAIVADPANRRVPQSDLLQALFDLTPAEARIARHMMAGLRPGAIAAEMGNSTATVRSHLKRIFLKTGVSRQADLATLLGALGGHPTG